MTNHLARGRRLTLKRPAPLFLWPILALLLAGCAVRLDKPQAQPLETNLGPVRSVAETGDWLVIRGVTGPDDFIGSVTNMPFSHAAIYDASGDQVVESDHRGVHLTPLDEFLRGAARVWVVKPVWATPENRPKAAARALETVGRPYDFLGLIGLGFPDHYYCTEVVMNAWRPFIKTREHNPIPLVISPGRLHHWGRVVYDSMEVGE
jgi:hypothetical protein